MFYFSNFYVLSFISHKPKNVEVSCSPLITSSEVVYDSEATFTKMSFKRAGKVVIKRNKICVQVVIITYKIEYFA